MSNRSENHTKYPIKLLDQSMSIRLSFWVYQGFPDIIFPTVIGKGEPSLIYLNFAWLLSPPERELVSISYEEYEREKYRCELEAIKYPASTFQNEARPFDWQGRAIVYRDFALLISTDKTPETCHPNP